MLERCLSCIILAYVTYFYICYSFKINGILQLQQKQQQPHDTRNSAQHIFSTYSDAKTKEKGKLKILALRL